MPTLRDAVVADLAAIRALLEQAGMPTSDLEVSKPRFKVLCEGGDIVAAGGMERFGSAALVRSVVVAADLRGAGLGRIIVEELERAARSLRIVQLIELTQTAREFFLQQGYRVVARSSAPEEVQRSEEFRSLCPASATCMVKILTETA